MPGEVWVETKFVAPKGPLNSKLLFSSGLSHTDKVYGGEGNMLPFKVIGSLFPIKFTARPLVPHCERLASESSAMFKLTFPLGA